MPEPYKVKTDTGYDVYEGSRHIKLPEFKRRGLNIDWLPEKSSPITSKPEPEPKEEITGTGRPRENTTPVPHYYDTNKPPTNTAPETPKTPIGYSNKQEQRNDQKEQNAKATESDIGKTPTSNLVRIKGQRDVYEKTDSGLKKIEDPEELRNKGYSFAQVQDISPQEFKDLTGTAPNQKTESNNQSPQQNNQSQQQNIWEKAKQFFGVGNTMTRKEALNAAEQEMGIDVSAQSQELQKIQDKMKTTRENLNSIQENKQAELDRNSSRNVAQGIIDREAKQIKAKYQRKRTAVANTLQAQAANAEMIQGNMDKAMQLTNTLVDDATQRERQQMNNLQNFMQMNSEWYKALPEDQQKRWEEITGDKQRELEQKRQRLQNLKDTYIENGLQFPENFANMSVSKVEKDLNQKISQQPAESELLSPNEAQKLGVPYGTTKKQAAQMGIVPSSEEGGAGEGEELSIPQKRTQLNDLTDNQTQKLNGISQQIQQGTAAEIPESQKISPEQRKKYGFPHRNVSKSELKIYKSLPKKMRSKLNKYAVYSDALQGKTYKWQAEDWTYSEAKQYYSQLESQIAGRQPKEEPNDTSQVSDNELLQSYESYQNDNPEGLAWEWVNIMTKQGFKIGRLKNIVDTGGPKSSFERTKEFLTSS